MDISIVAILVTGLLSGIFFRSFIDLGASFYILIFFLSVTIYLLKRQLLFSIFLFGLALGVLRFDMVDSKKDLSGLAKFEHTAVQATGVIIDEPREKDHTTTLIASISLPDQPPFYVQILTQPFTKFGYGDEIKVYGTLEGIKNFSSDFDYQAYLAKDEIYYQFLNPKISIISHDNGSVIQSKLFDFKNSYLENINVVVPEPESSLMGGLILGAKSSLDKNLVEDFKRVGLIHIVALSGYNVTVVVDYLMKMVWFLPLVPKLLIGSIFVVLFALMTGGGSTVVRASLMVLLAMLARATGRIYLVGSALLVAAALMILYNPKIFVFDTSFQLSFLATAGLIFFTPILEKRLMFVTERFGLRAALISTLAAQFAVWPIILYKMGNFSFVSIPANLLVTPVVPITMFLGFVTGFVGYANYYLSLTFGGISYLFLFYIVKITELFSELPFASMTVDGFPFIVTVLIYLAYLVWIITTGLTNHDTK